MTKMAEKSFNQFNQYELPAFPAVNPILAQGSENVLSRGELKSPNFVKDERGWAVNSDGDAWFRNARINGNLVSTRGFFGGNGSDGHLGISSGTTTINLGGEAIIVKNYTSISITGTGVLTFSNPHANGTLIILKSQGDVVLTSSSAPMIDASGMGAQGGASVTRNTVGDTNGVNGTVGKIFKLLCDFGDGATFSGPAPGGIAPVLSLDLNTFLSQSYFQYPNSFIGAGGGSGTARVSSGTPTVTSGAGGRGGGGLIIECGMYLNFTTVGGISVAGKAGEIGTSTNNTQGTAGGGGGGGGGLMKLIYNLLIAKTGTITTAGGLGSAGTGGTPSHTGGGGGGSWNAGTDGTNSGVDGIGKGGDGGAGSGEVIENNSK